ncbi:MAG: arsenite methyltransferase [Acidimicrobiia bacterium]|jgi:SAM-dependent methyltransferase
MPIDQDLRETVRQRYASDALKVLEGGPACCGSEDQTRYGSGLYDALEEGELPDAAKLASLGCGNPVAVADLNEGETVLDLGAGGGIDVLLSARRVGPTGKAYGLDMTDEMLELARQNAEEAKAENVEFLKGYIEEIPLPDASVDVIISNCVVNLSTNKTAVFSEMARVLRPGGRLGITDIVAEDHLSETDRAERGEYTGCIAGALSIREYEDHLSAAGFEEVSVTLTHPVADGMHSAIIKAGI